MNFVVLSNKNNDYIKIYAEKSIEGAFWSVEFFFAIFRILLLFIIILID
jgi:hypothetical protein